jgi:hypothetical protein
MQRHDFCLDGIFEFVARRDKCVNVFGDYAESNDTGVE